MLNGPMDWMEIFAPIHSFIILKILQMTHHFCDDFSPYWEIIWMVEIMAKINEGQMKTK